MLYTFFTKLSHNIIDVIPKNIPMITFEILDISIASGIKSKHIIALISPAANCNTKLRNLLDGFLNVAPIIPPIVVPKVPKKSPKSVVLIIFSTKISSE